MTFFILFSLLFLLKSISENKFLYVFLAGIMLAMAFLSKGFVGLYLLSFYFWYWIIFRQYSFAKMLIKTMILFLSMGLPFLLLFLVYPFGFQSLMNYIDNQVINSLSNVVTVDSRFHIIKSLFEQIALPLFVAIFWIVILWFVNRKQSFHNFKFEYKLGAFFFALGLSGVLPIMLSLKQSNFYILTTFPFFAIALASIITQFPSLKVNDKIKILSSILSVLLFSSAIIYAIYNFGTFSRDKDKITDIKNIKNEIPTLKAISIDHSIWSDWALFGYASRFGNFDFYRDNIPSQIYLLSLKNEKLNNQDSCYSKVVIELKLFTLYKLNTANNK
jgi:hypothetical protein